jgi:hypothetical protein
MTVWREGERQQLAEPCRMVNAVTSALQTVKRRQWEGGFRVLCCRSMFSLLRPPDGLHLYPGDRLQPSFSGPEPI